MFLCLSTCTTTANLQLSTFPLKGNAKKTDTGGGAFQAMLVPNLTDPYKTFDSAFSTADRSPDNRTPSNKFYMKLSADVPGPNAKRLVSVVRVNRCLNLCNKFDMPRNIAAGPT